MRRRAPDPDPDPGSEPEVEPARARGVNPRVVVAVLVAGGWFDQQRVVVERAPQDWRGWFRLAQAYNLAGDRKRAREALRTAIEKSEQRGSQRSPAVGCAAR